MLVFVDESGDPGLKTDRGSSDYFVVALVVFEDNDVAKRADQRINRLRRELNLHSQYEFRFNKCSASMRTSFLTAVESYSFSYYGIVINKSKLTGPGFRFKGPFYKYVTRLVFENAKDKLENATVILDGSGSRDFRNQLQTYLKKKINSKGSSRIKKVKVQDSRRNNLIQLADMVTGAVHRSFGTKQDASTYRNIISHREIFVQFWPK